MANFAKLGKGNKVFKVEPIHNDCASTEQAGIDFLNGLYKTNDVWKQVSYNTVGGLHLLGGTPFRKNYPGIGCTYDPARDAFIRPRPSGMDSWIFNESKCVYECPVARPAESTDRFEWIDWIESSQRWERKFPAKDSDGNDVYPSDMEEYWNPDTSSWVSI